MARVRPSSNTPAFANSLYLRGRIILFVEFYDSTYVRRSLSSFVHSAAYVWVKSI